MMRIDVFVEQAKGADRLTPFVGEEGICNAVFCRERRQYVYRIIADGKKANSCAFEVRQTALQLNELRLAEGSPGGATMEDHQGTMLASESVQINEMAMLIREDDIRETISDCRANLAKIDKACHARFSFLLLHAPQQADSCHQRRLACSRSV
jgi:hypothetical protein